MSDTTPEAARICRERLLSRSGEERFRMGCEVLETAKALALAGLKEGGEADARERLFLLLYGNDFEPDGASMPRTEECCED